MFTMPPHTTTLLILTHGDAADPIPSAVQQAWERLQQRYPRGFAHWAWVQNPLMIKMVGAW